MKYLLAGLTGAALLVNGARAEFVPTSGTYNGLMFESGGQWQQSSGYLTIRTTRRGTYTGLLRIGSGRYGFSGRLDANGSGSADILRYRQYPLSLSFQVSPEDPDLLTGSVTDGIWTADMIADRVVYDGVNSICPDAGRYTLVIPGNVNDVSAPGGDSFGTIRISKAGRLEFAGSLADGRKFTQYTTISKGGQWPLYSPLYAGQGSIYAWMLFNDPEGDDVGGDVTWIRPEFSGAWYYPEGFAINVYSWGSRYVPPPAGTRVMDITAGSIEFVGGNLDRSITNRFTLNGLNRVVNQSVNGLKMNFVLSTGQFFGRVMDPITWEWIPFSGVVLQRFSLGAGYFLGWNESGEVWLQNQ